ncbi:MAG: TlpA disulfide reductase family protein [Bacteroidales bacterium]|nr:AhpC/TSA family protein [Bacteroidales bacterium]MDD2424610.1 TlpA disulfide reductase family protein [Bacteroidales bacterium]MDD3988716.1 TlpA disulfide reductase family protein [Bacteroidales bacterium]MDD4638950.1 TlpA disulfide reductase family protein [Bacteroidales bacterium]
MNLFKSITTALIILPVVSFAQQGYKIKCTVGALNPPAKAYLVYPIGDNKFVDSTTIINGQFIFEGEVSSPRDANIIVKHNDIPDNPVMKPVRDVIAFYIENKEISITAKDSIKNGKLSGSELNVERDRMDNILRPLYAKYGVLDNEYKSQPKDKKNDPAYIKTLDERAEKITEEIIGVKREYVSTHPDSYLSIVLLNSTVGEDFDAIAIEKIFDKLNESVRKTELGNQLRNRILEHKKTQIGVVAQDFTMNDTNGKPVRLSDFRGKYLLLDFWASWCAPCRRENPNLVENYKKFKDKGFEILGVSLDKPADREKWIKAIEADGLAWIHVSDLKEWDCEAAAMYSVKAIPMNFLIDPDGVIIAKYLRGAELTKKLEEIFK